MKKQDFLNQLEKAAGTLAFPFTIHTNQNDEVVDFTYETHWKDGGTTPVEDEHGKVIDYKQSYETKKLTDKQITALDTAVKSILK